MYPPMERIAIIALLMVGLNASAQTPFDSFAPEATRPMLELEESTNTTSDAILCAIVADVQNQIPTFFFGQFRKKQ